MTSRNADNLVYEVAAILGLVVAGEALSSTDYDTIDKCIDPVIEEVERIVVINRDDIPGPFFQTLARLTAVHSAAKFSNTPVDLATVRQHEIRLRELAARDAPYQPVKVDYF